MLSRYQNDTKTDWEGNLIKTGNEPLLWFTGGYETNEEVGASVPEINPGSIEVSVRANIPRFFQAQVFTNRRKAVSSCH